MIKGNVSAVLKMIEELTQEVFFDSDAAADLLGRNAMTVLSDNTPVDRGVTANSYGYYVDKTGSKVHINVYNTSFTDNGLPLVILLNYGHLTINGSFVRPEYFIERSVKQVKNKADFI